MKNNILYLFMYSGFMISVFIPVFRVLTYFIPLVMYFIYIKRKTIRIKCMEAVVLGLVDCFVNYVITKLVLNSSLFNSYSLLDEIDGISSTLTISSLGISLIFLLLVVYILVMVTNGKKYNLLLVSNLAKYIDKNFYNVASDILTTLKEKNKKVVVLLIMDGIGIRKEKKGNAVLTAKTPNLDKLNKYPHCSLEASGRAVGLSDCQMGNSEVGHITIGSGRVSYQSKVRIDEKVNDKTLFNNKILNDQIKNKRVHVIGLVSDGGVHSHINHYIEMVKYLKNSDVKEVFCHVITDGRDTLPDCSYKYIKMIEKINEVSSISGRYYPMDRDNNIDRIDKYYDMIRGTMTCSKKVEKFINDSYKNKIYDEFLEPTMFVKNSKIEKDDLIIWMNFRPDRAVELIGKFYKDGYDVITLMKIRDSIKYPYLIDDLHISNTLGEVLERNNLKQLRIAETEKYNHVTYFFDGGRDLKLKNSDNILVASPKVATYDLKPEMSINEVNEKLLAKLDENIYDVVIVNYANGDMVGHTGNMDAAVQAVEAVDNAVGKLYDKVKEKDGILIITADHGNCEYMIDDDNNIVTTHTTNKVNFVLCNENVTLKDGGLADIAPTILDILNIEKPVDMTGESLIK